MGSRAPNGDILTTNAGDGNIVETSPAGEQLMVRALDTKTGAGSLFAAGVPQPPSLRATASGYSPVWKITWSEKPCTTAG